MSLPDEVRRHAADVAARARLVTVDHEALDALEPGPAPAPDRERHLTDAEADLADLADYVLTLNAINFGSGWFPTLAKRPRSSGYWTVAWSLADRFRADGAWTAAQLRTMSAEEIAGVLGQSAGHPLMALYAEALRALGRWLGERRAGEALDRAAAGSAARLAAAVVDGMPFYRDHGLYKRAQILAHDLDVFGVMDLEGLDRLTMFADNLVPHVLRTAGVLRYDPDLAAVVDAEEPLPMHRAEHEIRACAVHAVELLSQRTGVPPRELDAWLWDAGQRPEVKALPRHRCRTVFY